MSLASVLLALWISSAASLPFKTTTAKVAEDTDTSETTKPQRPRYDDTLTVTPSRTAVERSRSGRFVEVLTREQIERRGLHSLPELLQLIPGVDVRRRGVLGAQADVSLRGASFEQVLVLVDGVPMNDPQTGHHNMDLPVPVGAIERVEVLFGPAAAQWGADAAGGVIQIITRRDSQRSLTAEAYSGQNSLSGLSLSASLSSKPDRAQTVAFDRLETQGYKVGTELSSSSGWYRGVFGAGANQHVDLSAGVSQRDFGAQSFYSTRFPNQRERTETGFLSTGWQRQAAHGQVWLRGAFRQHRDLFVLDRFDPGLLTNRHRARTLDVESGWRRKVAFGTWEIGAGLTQEALVSTNLGDRERTRWALRGSLSGERAAWSWQAALHLDRVESGRQSTWEMHPNVALSRDLPIGRLRASVGTAYRIPSFTELYYLDPASAGSADLEPERSLSYELGWDWAKERQRVAVTLFERHGRDLIDFVLAPSDTLFRARNLRAVDTQGAELVWEHKLGSRTRPVGLTFSYAYLHASGDEPEGISGYVFDYLEHRALLRTEGSTPWRLEWAADLSWNERHQQDPYPRLDLSLGRRIGDSPVHLFAQVTNVTDERYFEQGSVQMPGRWALGGVRVTLVGHRR